MASNIAFNGQGNTLVVAAGVAAATTAASFAPANQPAATATGLTLCPPQVRIVNPGSATVWVSITTGARVAAIPTPGASSLEFPVLPNEDMVYTHNQAPQPSQTPAQDMVLNINTISGTAGQSLIMTFGEGL